MYYEQKYITLLSGRLERFKRVSHNLWNCRCPICGDSAKSKTKARGYFYEKKGKYWFHCHNCGVTRSLESLLKNLDTVLYQEYVTEKYLEENAGQRPLPLQETTVPKISRSFVKPELLKDLPRISQLKPEHYAKKYIHDRLIPTEYHAKLYYCTKFKSFVNSIIPGKFKPREEGLPLENDNPRIIIPFLDKEGNCFGFQGRSLDPNEKKLRYITIIVDETKPRVFGLDTVDFNKKFYVFEGPFDSMFIPNSIAICGSDVMTTLLSLDVDRTKAVIVMDNEPRNRDIVRNMTNAVNLGYNVVIWPESLLQKDINDMIKEGKMTSSEVNHMMDEHTYSSLEAMLKLTEWKRI